MDAFSLSIVLGNYFQKKNAKLLVIITGIFHFIMPLLGALLGYKTINLLNLDNDYILGTILVILSIQVFINIIKKEDITQKFTYFTIISIAFGVSIDSFTVGFGLVFSNINIFVSAAYFAFFSSVFTLLGLIIGKYFSKVLGVYSKIIGALMLLLLGIYNLI